MSFINTAIDAAKKTANDIGTTVEEGRRAVVDTASSKADEFNEKAVRASTSQMCRMLEIAAEEIKARPLSAQPVSLAASLNIGIATLRMQIHLQPAEQENSGESVVLPKTT